MVTEFDYPVWIILAFGVYSLTAGMGEFRSPGIWASMIDDFEAHPSLRFLTGIFCLSLGTVLYLIEPWGRADWMLYAVKIIGAWMAIEGALFLAVGDWFTKFARGLIGASMRIWAALAMVIGIAMIIAAGLRILAGL